MLRATTLLSRVAIVPILRPHITTIVHRGATTLPAGVPLRRAATTRPRTAIIRPHLTPPRAAAAPHRAVIPRPRLAPLVAALAVDSTVVVAVDPTAEAEAALTAAVGAAPMVAVVVTNPNILQTSRSPLP